MVIVGEINFHNEVTFPFAVQDRHGEIHGLTAVLDTGFSGNLTLPPILLNALGLTPIGDDTVTLGDGSERTLALYEVTVRWGEEEFVVKAFEADGPPLIGMRLIRGYNVVFQASDGGPAVAYK